jgi:hypothetical protein
MSSNDAPVTSAPDFRTVQAAFTAHIRDPAQRAAPAGIEDRRLGVYRELIYNNVEGFLHRTFPVLRGRTADEVWHRWVRAFLASHASESPLFRDIPRAFLDFVAAGGLAEDPDTPVFLLELAHYEWAEMALFIAEDPEEPPCDPPCDPHGDWLLGRPVVSRLAWLLAYTYPVHRIRRDTPEAEIEPGQSLLVMYRDPETYRVRTLEVNPLTARLLQLITEEVVDSAQAAVDQIAVELGKPDSAGLSEKARGLLADWHAKGIVRGIRTGSNGGS